MSDYSAVAPPPQPNFNQSTAFAAALQRAKQVSHRVVNNGPLAVAASHRSTATAFPRQFLSKH